MLRKIGNGFKLYSLILVVVVVALLFTFTVNI